jgi:putative colanic acid biosynthesis acetyltransferase WcaF
MNVNLWGGAFLNYFYNNLLTHFPSHFIRKSFLRLINKKIHASAVILMHTRLLYFWKIEIGENVVINQYCLLDCRVFKIHIEHNTDIGPYTRIWTAGHNPDSPTHAIYGGDVNIGHHVWIASGVTILPGVTIADGTVVASASVVHKSTAVNDVIAGNPARVVKKRNNELQYRLVFNPILE